MEAAPWQHRWLPAALHCSADDASLQPDEASTAPAALHCNSGGYRRCFIATRAVPAMLNHSTAGGPPVLHCNSGGLAMLHRKTGEPAIAALRHSLEAQQSAVGPSVATTPRGPMLRSSSPQPPDCSICGEWQPPRDTVAICSSGGGYHAAPQDLSSQLGEPPATLHRSTGSHRNRCASATPAAASIVGIVTATPVAAPPVAVVTRAGKGRSSFCFAAAGRSSG